MFNYKNVSLVIFLILFLVLWSFFYFNKEKDLSNNETIDKSIKLSDREILNIRNWVLENSNEMKENMNVNDF